MIQGAPGAVAGQLLATGDELVGAARRVREPLRVLREEATGRPAAWLSAHAPPPGWSTLAVLPPLYPEWLGDRTFGETHGTRFPYVTGAMANGIATVELVERIAEAGAIGFFGAAGLAPARVEAALDRLEQGLGAKGLPWGSNLIHVPAEPSIEASVADLYVRRQVRRVSASAYMDLTAPLVRYAAAGLRQRADGSIERRGHVFAKVSRPEVARRFFEPAPEGLLAGLVRAGQLTAAEAALARRVPLAEDVTAEADSGGHTDNRPLTALVPVLAAERDRIARERGYARPIRIGAAGGLGTPGAVAAAFALGAAYVLTGSVNQACVESGLSAEGRALLATAGLADVAMAPAADMFELGVTVQVLRRGTMFAPRAKRLYELYRAHASLEAVPEAERVRLEKEILRRSCADAWADTRAYWQARDASEVERAERDPHHRMALVFRSYLGLASRWAIQGLADRRADFQIWCGPAMGAFNEWVKGTFLEDPSRREAAQVAWNLLEGAAVVTRAGHMRAAGLPMPPSAFDFRPRPLA